ncbi:Transcriptional activator flo8 [Coemansia sp. RSA 2599]|nr:Transcriptional activator flo8 [Coemansia sp. RSA 2598]KAJ1829614.1 Transcriptional activator flo8 [Coemansia sp. RSA 2599]
MVHETLLNAYVFDFLKKKGFHQTAIHFADECKDLPLIKPSDGDAQASLSLASSGTDSSATAIGAKDEEGSSRGSSASKQKSPTPSVKSSDAQPLAASQSVPGINVPINTPRGFLLEWWSVFWDVFAASSERSKHQVPDSVRAYVSHQQTHRQGRKPSPPAANVNVNGNGKRSALQ